MSALTLAAVTAQASGPASTQVNPPRIVMTGGASQLLVNGKPFLALGGELGNSSAGTAAQADSVLPNLARMHLNLALMPVAWEQVEPVEGQYDFSILDHWIDVARAEHMHLGLLWFGSWKNSFSNYAPAWVKSDAKRFPRAISAEGEPTEILSTFGANTQASDSHAFAQLLRHVREKDAREQTVVLVQVENEVGFLGRGRDRSDEANRVFQNAVPNALVQKLNERRLTLSPELVAHFNPDGKTWKDVFGEAASEVFMAWRYATFINEVAVAGKREYALPMYTNAQLPAELEQPGEYPSGGPHPYYLEVYRAIATSIDMFSPDIYWPDFAYWINRYRIPSNPIFVPEAQLEPGAYNALYALGEAHAFGFCPFGIDALHPTESSNGMNPQVMESYGELASISDLLITAQTENRSRAIVLHANSPRAHQTVALGGYLFEASLLRTWPSNELSSKDGAILILQSAPDEFLVVGSGMTVKIARDVDADNHVAGISSIEEVTRSNDTWMVKSRLNGDQSNQGRQLDTDPAHFHTYRVRLYNYAR
ncbi:DUF5597 domain-containing protein [Telmatobacter bradus]|uniref:GH35 family beta-galactosidase n=1 Tax=Telmatobacter bradus TaxID=474953 RepID=UPI003B43182B